MPADEHLGGQFVGYHYADPENRESITALGLLTHHPEAGSLAERDEGPAGVYMFHDVEQAKMLDAGDVWEVQLPTSRVKPDPYHADKPGVASYSEEPVSPKNIRLIHRYDD